MKNVELAVDPDPFIRKAFQNSIPVAVALANRSLSDLNPHEQAAIAELNQNYEAEMQNLANEDSPQDHGDLKRNLAARAYDEHLRLSLGWDRFNTLSALAAQIAQLESVATRNRESGR